MDLILSFFKLDEEWKRYHPNSFKRAKYLFYRKAECFGNQPSCWKPLPSSISSELNLEIHFSDGGLWAIDGVRAPDLNPLVNEFLVPQIHSYMELLHAIVLVDIGNILSNNVLVHPSTVLSYTFPRVYAQPFGQPGRSVLVPNITRRGSKDSRVYYPISEFSRPGTDPLRLPLVLDSGPPIFEALYLCRQWVPKSVGSAFVSVLVATITMMTTAYAALIFIGSLWIKRRDHEGKIFPGRKENELLTRYLCAPHNI